MAQCASARYIVPRRMLICFMTLHRSKCVHDVEDEKGIYNAICRARALCKKTKQEDAPGRVYWRRHPNGLEQASRSVATT
ncbi:hypothetical protein DICSQDRAFT_140230 [Dichomitus squalens LYAD-421 SS1]|uniref:Uncharacterized protein n=1 Tax=Dichomitus squalens (strain LYAD-421) TaxID=732165 RepID=R7SPN8_DICSQ|nr:uncharacterized protein DICSQDRAFT_140230 [Dichomitus squalens LYAD-421 SS1]EJF57670.1 hypothetical protein DICSQDRAFT_140230 [Dichomitus squalens LYAD-421 SS1]